VKNKPILGRRGEIKNELKLRGKVKWELLTQRKGGRGPEDSRFLQKNTGHPQEGWEQEKEKRKYGPQISSQKCSNE